MEALAGAGAGCFAATCLLAVALWALRGVGGAGTLADSAGTLVGGADTLGAVTVALGRFVLAATADALAARLGCLLPSESNAITAVTASAVGTRISDFLRAV